MGFFRDFLRARLAAQAAAEPRERIMGQLGLGKGLLWSKTFRVNLLVGVIAALSAVGGIPFLPVTVVPWIGVALAIANILLRAVTKEPITSIR